MFCSGGSGPGLRGASATSLFVQPPPSFSTDYLLLRPIAPPPPPHLALGGPAPSVLARTATGVLTAAAVNKDDDDEGDDEGDIERV